MIEVIIVEALANSPLDLIKILVIIIMLAIVQGICI